VKPHAILTECSNKGVIELYHCNYTIGEFLPLRGPQGSTSSPHFEVPRGRSRGREPVESVEPVHSANSSLPRTTESSVRQCGDSPYEIIFSFTTLSTPLAAISRAESFALPPREAPQFQRRKAVVRGLLTSDAAQQQFTWPTNFGSGLAACR